jgi:hypothetical protein
LINLTEKLNFQNLTENFNSKFLDGKSRKNENEKKKFKTFNLKKGVQKVNGKFNFKNFV